MSGRKKPRIPGAAPPKKATPQFNAPSTGKHAALTAGEFDYHHAKPVWRFQYLDHDAYGFDAADSDAITSVVQALGQFESMTLPELFNGHPGKHYEVETAHDNIKSRLADLGREDETRVSRLRLAGKPRLYGFLRENVFYVLWWDPKHQLWPSEKRNT